MLYRYAFLDNFQFLLFDFPHLSSFNVCTKLGRLIILYPLSPALMSIGEDIVPQLLWWRRPWSCRICRHMRHYVSWLDYSWEHTCHINFKVSLTVLEPLAFNAQTFQGVMWIRPSPLFPRFLRWYIRILLVLEYRLFTVEMATPLTGKISFTSYWLVKL